MKTIYIITLITFFQTIAVYAQEEAVLAPKEFKAKMDATPGAVVLDVRTPDEVDQGKLKGAVNIDFNNTDFQKEVARLDKSKTYFVYCAKGGRSSKAFAILKSSGFNNVYDLKGGYTAWNEMGMPIVKK
jgi:rhodanese-related sulfurtransferase